MRVRRARSRSTPSAGQHVADRVAAGVARARELGRVERPGERRAAEEAAAEARALLVGEVDQDEVARRWRARLATRRGARRAPPSRRARRRASRPPGTESRWEPTASAGASRSAPGSRAQRLPASSRSGSIPSSASLRAQQVRARVASPSPQQSRCAAVRPAGQLVELAQVGDHAGRVDRRARRRRAQAHALPPQRLREAVGAAAAEREHLEVGVEDRRGRAARSCSLRRSERRVEITRSSPSEIALTPSPKASATETSRISKPASRSQRDQAGRGGLDADGGELRREDRDEHVDVDEVGRDRLDPHLPAELLEPAAELRARRPASVRSSPLPIRTRPGSTMITSPPSSEPAVIIPRIGIPASS